MSTSMTSEEVRDFLKSQRTLILSTVKKDGAPVAHALWFTYADDAVYFDTQSASFKARNIERDGRVCCLVEAGDADNFHGGLMVLLIGRVMCCRWIVSVNGARKRIRLYHCCGEAIKVIFVHSFPKGP